MSSAINIAVINLEFAHRLQSYICDNCVGRMADSRAPNSIRLNRTFSPFVINSVACDGYLLDADSQTFQWIKEFLPKCRLRWKRHLSAANHHQIYFVLNVLHMQALAQHFTWYFRIHAIWLSIEIVSGVYEKSTACCRRYNRESSDKHQWQPQL